MLHLDTILILLVLLTFSALFSGLTLGLMSLDVGTLRRKMFHGNKDALVVYAVRKDGNLLLTTLLIVNVAINSAISIFLERAIGGFLAGLIATGVIFLACEVLPQAVVSRHALRFGAKFAWLVKIVLFVCYPICKPIALALNYFLGNESSAQLSKRELISVIDEYQSALPESEIDADEQRIARGSLLFSRRKVGDVMTPSTVVHTLEISESLDEKRVIELRELGFSRFPVYEKTPDRIVGVLYLRDLIGQTLPALVSDVYDSYTFGVSQNDNLDQVLNMFIEKKMHLFVVYDEFGGFEGVITMEDIIEEIIGREIVDEDDQHMDLRAHAKKVRGEKKGK